jgi:hypothetical protein
MATYSAGISSGEVNKPHAQIDQKQFGKTYAYIGSDKVLSWTTSFRKPAVFKSCCTLVYQKDVPFRTSRRINW